MLTHPDTRAEVDAIAAEFREQASAYLREQASPRVLDSIRALALGAGYRIAQVAPSVDPPTRVRIIGRGSTIFLRFMGVSDGLAERLRYAGLAPAPEANDDCPQCGGSGGGEGPRRCHVCRGLGRIPDTEEDYYDVR